MKLAFRFTVALVAAMTLALALNAYLRVRREVVHFDQKIANHARAMSRTLGPFVAETWREEGVDAARELVENAGDVDDIRVRLTFLDGAAADAPRLSAIERQELQSAGFFMKKLEDDAGVGTAVTYVRLSLPTPRPVVLEFSEPMQGENAFVRQAVFSAVLTALVLALLCAMSTMMLGVFFVGRPVRALVAQARRIGAGDFSEPLRLRQRDEIGDLAREFDTMRERLARARDELKAATDAKLAALDQLRHVERVATVGKLAAGVAHELGTPLQVVSGYARLIAEDDDSGRETRDNAGVIHEQTVRMTTIIRQLLDFARRRSTERSQTNLGDVLDRAVRLLTPVAERAGVRIETTLSDQEPFRAFVDAEQIIQVLSNLVVNAVQAMPLGGTIVVGIARAMRDVDGKVEPHVLVSVRDTGIGMSPDVRNHVFEPFFTTKPTGQGTGLGLSVAYGIVTDLGGHFEVESEPDRGSTFTVWLPVGEKR
ncbi:MAG: HAMP domain-containing protein [Polyangiaceae bacterium]|nr:HAMP domain-containing protein [Polyangiaceae bacterium]